MRIVIAEDSVLLRDGLTRLLAERGHEVVATAGDAVELLAAVAREDPDVAIVDVRMPPTFTDEGVRAALELRERSPAWPSSCSRSTSRSATRASCWPATRAASATCSRTASPRRATSSSPSTGSPRAARRSTPRWSASSSPARRRGDPLDDLSPREREVLSLMAEGRSNGAIAARLVVTERAVEKHVSSIFAKLRLPPTEGDHRRVLAVLRYLEAAR